MGNRLFSDLQSGGGQRYFFDLDSTPGIITPGVGALSLVGREPQYPGTVFRTPATLILSLDGRSPNPDVSLRPAQAALAFNNSTVGLQTVRLIQPTLASPVESPDNDFVPTLIQIFHRQPITGVITLSGFNHSLSEGGNIGFRSPATAALSLIGYPYLRSIPPVDGQSISMIMEGLQPTLTTTLLIEPEPATLSFTSAPPSIDKGFIWIDDNPAPPLQWT